MSPESVARTTLFDLDTHAASDVLQLALQLAAAHLQLCQPIRLRAHFRRQFLLGLLPRLRLGRWRMGQDPVAPELSLRTFALACLSLAAGAWMIILPA